MNAQLLCQICLNTYLCSQFKSFICGHGYCKTCVDTLFERSPTKCPACRRALRRVDVHDLFLDLQVVDPKVTFTDKVIEGFGKMDEATPLDSVKRAAEKIERGAKVSKGDKDLTTRLLESIEDFKQRIIPVFALVQSQRQEIATLKAQAASSSASLHSLQNRFKRLDALPAKLTLLEHERDKALQLAEDAATAVVNLRSELDTARTEREQYQKMYEATENEKRHIAGRDAANAGALKRTREKLAHVREELKDLKEKHQHLVAESQMQMLSSSNPTSTSPYPYREPRQPQDYDDGDFSSHETRQPLQVRQVRAASSQVENQPIPIPDFEGLPRPGSFGSNWQLASNRSYGALGKVKGKMTTPPTHRRVANPMVLKLDGKGKPTTAVQLGPKRSLRV
ncbi:hypothetical protein D9611_012724 [Ephemerocybe angulata]|uniref:RING-type domain-containing protein n=1 Tax=Ephemerocybe angulata TaxID=980116 RepID=A0A8H5B947_9AGAR|nr:hypothetical protein D9611_012724 [Tulosesus angulatus]